MKLKERIKSMTLNEKLMYLLLLMFFVGIIVRWDYVSKEVGESFSAIFSHGDTTSVTQEVPQVDKK